MRDSLFWRAALVIAFLVALDTGYTVAWLVVCGLLIRRLLVEHDRGNAYGRSVVRLTRERTLAEEALLSAQLAGEGDRNTRINDKLKARCASLEKLLTEANDTIRKLQQEKTRV